MLDIFLGDFKYWLMFHLHGNLRNCILSNLYFTNENLKRGKMNWSRLIAQLVSWGAGREGSNSGRLPPDFLLFMLNALGFSFSFVFVSSTDIFIQLQNSSQSSSPQYFIGIKNHKPWHKNPSHLPQSLHPVVQSLAPGGHSARLLCKIKGKELFFFFLLKLFLKGNPRVIYF